jgi:hypothetical protein
VGEAFFIHDSRIILPGPPGSGASPRPEIRIEALRTDPFLGRIEALVVAWLQEEWSAKEQIRGQAAKHGWTPQLKTAFKEACLTPRQPRAPA